MNDYIDAYKEMWTRFLDFSGRTDRGTFWKAILVNIVVSLLASLIFPKLHLGLIPTMYSVAVCIPSIAMEVRRLKDIGKPWYWMLLVILPVIGPIWLIVLFCKESV